jgi:hypothetical protein
VASSSSKAGIVGVELFQPLHRLLGLGVLFARVLRFLGADLVFHLRIDEDLLGDRVADELDGDLLGDVLAPRLGLLRRGSHGATRAPRTSLDLPVILLEHLDHIALISHRAPP